MRVIHLMSDLHLEFHYREHRRAWIKNLNNKGVDILVLAGDICNRIQLKDVMEEFCAKYANVVYVPGNHEYYHTEPKAVRDTLSWIQDELKNFHWLDNKTKEVEGLKFIGGTLWFSKPSPEIYKNTIYMGDFNAIKGFEPWVYEEHHKFKELLKNEATGADIIVTHHLPADKCIDMRYRSGPMSTLNHFFCHDMTVEILNWQPKLWLHGHTHSMFDGKIKNTRIVCNPMGYSTEGLSFSSYVPKIITLD